MELKSILINNINHAKVYSTLFKLTLLTLEVEPNIDLMIDYYFIFAAWKWNTHWIQLYWKMALQSGNISSLPL
jgi:hypothetical protein